MSINAEKEKALYAKMAAFVIAMAVIGFILMLATGALAQSTPATWTLQGVAEWSQKRIASGSALPATSSYSVGDLFTVTSDPPILYRLQSGAWATMTGSVSGGASDASLTAHIADQVDPHGATETISVSLQIGSGTPDTFFFRFATGTIGLATFVYIPPTSATPTSPASFTLWGDSNTGKLRCYDGSAWQNLW